MPVGGVGICSEGGVSEGRSKRTHRTHWLSNAVRIHEETAIRAMLSAGGLLLGTACLKSFTCRGPRETARTVPASQHWPCVLGHRN